MRLNDRESTTKWKVNHTSGIHTDCIRFGLNESKEHRKKKCELCDEFLEAGQHYICEAEFTNGSGKCDVLNLSNKTCYEIKKSESKASLEAKAEKYPVRVKVVEA